MSHVSWNPAAELPGPAGLTDGAMGRHLLDAANVEAFSASAMAALQLLAERLRCVERPFSGIAPDELARAFAAVALDQPLDSFAAALAELGRLWLHDAVWFHHPRYLAHFNCPVAYPAVAAELLAAAVNASVDTWDQSAGATLIEQGLIDWTAQRIGYDPDRADGVFTSGGTQSNMMALLLARDNHCLVRLDGHSVQRDGLPAQASRFRIFASRLAHFSVQKAAAVLGLGARAVVAVDCDAGYRMAPQALQQAIATCRQEGGIPIAVVATLGTTDFGSIDPMAELAPICRDAGVWLHADAAYGCGLLVSGRHRHRIAGIEQADSVTVDFHKSFFQPVSCSALVVRHKEHLGCLTWHADYLNPLSQEQEHIPNLVSKSLQTTRRFDALKLWVTLRALGPEQLGAAFDAVIERAHQAHDLLLQQGDFEVLAPPSLSTVLFRHAPGGLADPMLLDALNEAIRKAMMRQGEALIAATREQGRSWLKFTLLNPATTLADIAAVLEMMRHHGQTWLEAHAPTPRSTASPLESTL